MTPPSKSKSRLPLAVALLLVGAVGGVWYFSGAAARRGTHADTGKVARESARIATSSETGAVGGEPWSRAVARAALQRRLSRPDARPGEALLTFKDAAAYRRFLARAGGVAGLSVIASSDSLLSVRVKLDDVRGLEADAFEHGEGYEEIGANYFMDTPRPPAKEEREGRVGHPVGNNLLAALGVTAEDRSTWGRGVTVAILDSGVAADATFGTGRLRALDVGYGTAGADGHGTGVASLAAGAAPDAPGVAPAASVLSIKVTGADGRGDSFGVATALVKAVDAGARVINISMGGYSTSEVLSRAIDYARARGAVIVAAAGNDQAAELMWPAADARVISVAAVDAREQQALFSNSGEQLQIAAPGYAVRSAWAEGQRVLFSGTSASAPVVAGSIAAVMSQTPGLTATQAWDVLKTHANDTGAPGADTQYGHGVLNLGWAMNRSVSGRVDTAISSHYFNERTGQVEVVVQNRSTVPVSGAEVVVEANGAITRTRVAWLAPGASSVVSIAPKTAPTVGAPLILQTQLNNPQSVVDAVPANNQRSSVFRPAR